MRWNEDQLSRETEAAATLDKQHWHILNSMRKCCIWNIIHSFKNYAAKKYKYMSNSGIALAHAISPETKTDIERANTSSPTTPSNNNHSAYVSTTHTHTHTSPEAVLLACRNPTGALTSDCLTVWRAWTRPSGTVSAPHTPHAASRQPSNVWTQP